MLTVQVCPAAFCCSAAGSGGAETKDSEIAQPDRNLAASFNAAFSRVSTVRAYARMSASVGSAGKLTDVIQLQKYYSGKYRSISGGKSTLTVKSSSIVHACYFTVANRGKYRVRITLSWTSQAGHKFAETHYCNLTK
jgi:hypothetical protein